MPKPNEIFKALAPEIKTNLAKAFAHDNAKLITFEYTDEYAPGQGPAYVTEIYFKDYNGDVVEKNFCYAAQFILSNCHDPDKKEIREDILDNFLKDLNTDLPLRSLNYLY